MKGPTGHHIVFFFLIFLLFSCKAADDKSTGILKEIIPKSSAAIKIIESPILRKNENTAFSNITEEATSESELDSLLPRGYSILKTKWENIDNDDLEEAIVVISKKDQAAASVLIAKFDANNERYHFVWQANTGLMSNDVVTVTVFDIDLDGKKEIILEGSDKNMQQHIEVFMLNAASYNLRLYRQVFVLSTIGGGDIELELEIPSQAKIIAYNIFEEESKIIEKNNYLWNNAKTTFIHTSRETFSYKDIVKEKISGLNTKDREVWLEFLNGVWIKQTITETEPEEQAGSELIYFSKQIPQMNIVKGDSMKFYVWNKIYKGIRANVGIEVHLTDLLLPNFASVLNIEVLSEKEIYVHLRKDYDDGLNGVFVLASKKNVEKNVEKNTELPYFSYNRENRKKTISAIEQWLLGKKIETRTKMTYFFSPETVIVFSGAESVTHEYKIFVLSTDYFIEMRKQGELALFYRLRDFSRISTSTELVLEPYTITTTAMYPLEEESALVLVRDEE